MSRLVALRPMTVESHVTILRDSGLGFRIMANANIGRRGPQLLERNTASRPHPGMRAIQVCRSGGKVTHSGNRLTETGMGKLRNLGPFLRKASRQT